ncbi:MAG: molybdopterin molybdotransferase MoeA [Bacillota bacterium]|nr:molybdopterin molybdotransferase MoeA [Bacillota bacterium]
MAVGELIPLEEALERLLAELPAGSLGSEAVGLEAAAGRVLAEPVTAEEELPPFDRSTMDGYAVRAADVAAATEERPVRLRLAGEVRIGEPAGLRVEAGEAAAVPTGGALPAGADAVVPVEWTRPAGERVDFLRPVEPGENVAARASDVRPGQLVLPAGHRLRPQDCGLLAALGRLRVQVVRRPRVAVLATGNEVVPADRRPAPGQIRDANSWSLLAALRAGGLRGEYLGVSGDDEEAIRQLLASALARFDVVLVSGGSSVGDRDVTQRAVESLARVVAHGIAIKPGKPALLGVSAGKAVVGLPGHPVSALTIYRLLVRPLLQHLEGARPDWSRPGLRARLAGPVRAPAERDAMVSVRLRRLAPGGRAEGAPAFEAEPLRTSSAHLSSLVLADGMIRLARGARLEAGQEVEVLPFDD